MKKAVFFMALLFSVGIYSQDTKPTLEKVGKMVKATYFHENGEIAQTGHFLNGKLHGQWFMYDAKGKKIATGKYVNGVKSGKWLFWKKDVLKEVDFVDNKIVQTKDWSETAVASTNR